MNASTTLPIAAALYVAAWLVGLFAAPARPTEGDPAAVKDYFVAHGDAAVAQSLLVHGLAGVSLAAFAWAVSRLVSQSSPAVLGLGSAAAVLSLVQVGILLSIATGSHSLSGAAVAQRVGWIDSVDTAKLLALAAFAVVASAATVGSRLAGGWLLPVSVVLALLLVAGGASFVSNHSVLTAALYLSLPLLLLWVGALGVTVFRHDHAESAVTETVN